MSMIPSPPSPSANFIERVTVALFGRLSPFLNPELAEDDVGDIGVGLGLFDEHPAFAAE